MVITKIKQNQFLFTELVKRDFTKKYKRTILGMAWSILSPLMNLLIMWLVFSNFFGNNVDHYAIYLFAGQLVFSYFTDATNLGMNSLVSNAGIFTKINVPKYLFLLSQNVSSLINFGLTLLIFFTFVAIDGIPFTWKFILLLYPVCCLIVFNLGLGLILSALFVFFRDMQYLWGILTQLIMWMSAIFYTIDSYSYTVQCAFLLNPLYLYIRYFRKIVIDGEIPTLQFHLLAAFYALVALAIGAYMYKKNNHEFLYYV
jgi:ABC-2 type transport system permease protein